MRICLCVCQCDKPKTKKKASEWHDARNTQRGGVDMDCQPPKKRNTPQGAPPHTSSEDEPPPPVRRAYHPRQAQTPTVTIAAIRKPAITLPASAVTGCTIAHRISTNIIKCKESFIA